MHLSGQTAELTTLLGPVQGETLRSPVLSEHWLIYTSDRGGIDSIWALNRKDGRRYRVSQRPFGNYFIVLDEYRQRLLSTDYQAGGHALVEHPWTESMQPGQHWIAHDDVRQLEPYIDPLSKPAESISVDAGEAKRFRHWSGDWRPNSWLLTADNQAIALNLHNTNLLNTLTTDLSLGYNWAAQTPTGRVALDWRRYWPVISFTADQRPDASLSRLNTETRLTLSVPLQQTRGIARVGVEPSLGVSYLTSSDLDSNASAEATFVSTGLSGYWAMQPAHRDLQSPAAIAPSVQYDTQLNSGGYQLYLSNTVQTGGLADNHHITFSGQWQRREAEFEGSSRLPDSVVFDPAPSSRTMATSRANYRFSLGPVDQSLGRLWYIRSLNLAFDARLQIRDDEQRSAYGIQLSAPSNVLRNSRLRLEPTASVYYRPDQADWVPVFGITLGG
jgi:hypothetical protein